jgi:uncharacterized protein (DUF885 family)
VNWVSADVPSLLARHRYIEGWGLYAEYLGYEMGIYKDPAARFGALDAELWRAIRLVTDTGIHYKG